MSEQDYCPPLRETSASVKPWRNLQPSATRRAKMRKLNENPSQFGERVVFSKWTQAVGRVQSLIDTPGMPLSEVYLVSGADVIEDCWWIVDVVGMETMIEAAGIVEAFSKQQIKEFGTESSVLRGRVEWMRSGIGASMDFDIGTGARFAIEGKDVKVSILGADSQILELKAPDQTPSAVLTSTVPTQSVPVAGAQPQSLRGPGLFLGSIITAQVIRCTSTNADRSCTLTQSFNVAAGETLEVPIPSRAKRVKVSIPRPGARPPVQFRMGLPGLPVAPLVVRDLFFPPAAGGDFRSTSEVTFPENAGHLFFPADNNNARVVTTVWGLEL